MRSHTMSVGLATLITFLMLAAPAIVAAQAAGAPGSPGAAAAPEGRGSSLSNDATGLLILGGIVLLGLGIALLKLRDIQRKRDDEAVQLEAQIGDALLRDRTLARFPVAPSVHIPMSRRPVATVELHGQVPTTELRQSALRIAEQEAARFLHEYHIQDHITVGAPAGAHAT